MADFWQQLGQDIDGEASNDESGYSVSLSADGTKVAIGATYNDGSGNVSSDNRGSVRVYQYNGTSWIQMGQDIDGEASLDRSGYSVSLSADGTKVAIGAYLNDGSGNSKPDSGSVRVYQLITEQVVTSDICFRRGTPIATNQGIIPIEKINPSIHTIRNKKIIAITKTVTTDKYLVCFDKDAFGDNIPSQKTVMTKNHRVFYKGEMIEAKKFIGKVENVKKVNYSGDILYNVLMEKPDKMVVNNLICETLHPENCVAKLYTYLKDYSTDEQKILIKQVNDYAEKKLSLSSKKR